METILAAAISAAVTLVVCLVQNHAQNEKTRALLDYRLGELEKKVDKHNNFADRVPRLEDAQEEMKEDIKELKKTIHELHTDRTVL